MTGTAKTEEISTIWDVKLTFRLTPIARTDLDDPCMLVRTGKYKAGRRKSCRSRHETGQPVLVLTSLRYQSQSVRCSKERHQAQRTSTPSTMKGAEIVAEAGRVGVLQSLPTWLVVVPISYLAEIWFWSQARWQLEYTSGRLHSQRFEKVWRRRINAAREKYQELPWSSLPLRERMSKSSKRARGVSSKMERHESRRIDNQPRGRSDVRGDPMLHSPSFHTEGWPDETLRRERRCRELSRLLVLKDEDALEAKCKLQKNWNRLKRRLRERTSGL